MLSPIKSLLTFILLATIAIASHAQQIPINPRDLAHRLSAKNDFRSTDFLAISIQLQSLDSTRLCETIKEIEVAGNKRALYFRMQMLRLKSYLFMSLPVCDGWPPVHEMLMQALQLSYEINDPVLIAEMNRLVMTYYTMKLDYGSASVYGLIAREFELSAGVDQFSGSSRYRYFLGYVSFHARDYHTSIEASLDALHWQEHKNVDPADTLDAQVRMNAWNTIGLSYEKLGVYDSAFLAFNESSKLSKQFHNDFWTALVRGNQGDVYFNTGNYDSAKVLLREDVDQSMATNQWDNAGNSLQWIARIHAFEGNGQLALKEAREAENYLKRSPNPEFRNNLLYTYTQIFKTLDEADSVDFYMKEYLMLHDSIERVASDARAQNVRMRMDNQDFVHRIMILDKEKKKVALIRNLIILIILLAAITGYLFLHRERLKLKLRQQQVLEEKKRAEETAAEARYQLDIFTQNLVDKTNLVESLQARLLEHQLVANTENFENSVNAVTILTDDDWEKFKTLFESVHPLFFIQLKKAIPDITLAEQRMSALIKLHLPVKKAASILAISTNSVHKARQRLRHKLGLETDAELDAFFSGDSFSGV